jgi:Sulfotransferase family
MLATVSPGRGDARSMEREVSIMAKAAKGANGDDFPPPIFLLAPARSYTSLFCGIIGQHPELFGSPEFNLFRAETGEEFIATVRAQTGMYRFVAQVYAGEQTIRSIRMAQRWMDVRRDRTAAEIHRELCARIAPRALVQKSPAYTKRLVCMQRALETFPKARFIHLVRHPRGMAESALKFDYTPLRLVANGGVDRSGPWPVADPQIMWHDYHLRILRFQEMVNPDQWLRIKGEDFLADIDDQLRRLCEWLGVSTAPEAIAAMKRPEDSPFASFGPANALLGNDPNFLSAPQLRPYTQREQSLEGPLPWRPDEAPFYPRVIEMAQSFGYT